MIARAPDPPNISAPSSIGRTRRVVRSPRLAARAPDTPYAGLMASKSKPGRQPKKPGKSLKEQRAAKHQKQAEQRQVRKGWEAP